MPGLTALYGWDNIYRDDNRLDREAQLFGLFTETDFLSAQFP